MDPMAVLSSAVKQLPILKYAVGVVGLAAAVAVIATFQVSVELAVVGVVATFAMMICLALFTHLVSSGDEHRLLAQIMAWGFLVLSMVASSLLLLCFFFAWPRDLRAKPPIRQLEPLETGWIYAGIFNFDSSTWRKPVYFASTPRARPNVRARIPREGDNIYVAYQERNVVIEDFRTKGFTLQHECPILLKPAPDSIRRLGAEDYTGTVLPIGYRMEVRQVCVGNVPRQPYQAIYLRVADSPR